MIRITFAYSPRPRQVRELFVDVAPGTCVWQAVEQAGLLQELPRLELDELNIGIWGRRCNAHQVLKDQDRIEIYRPLRVDPKAARRERFVAQGVKRAGLFSTKKVQEKPSNCD